MRGEARRAHGRAFEHADCGPVILTRGELSRRTRERSKLAALKLAEEQGKARECCARSLIFLLLCTTKYVIIEVFHYIGIQTVLLIVHSSHSSSTI